MQTVPSANENFLFLEAVVGSRAYGLDTPTSDTDIRGVFLAPIPVLFGLEGLPEQVSEGGDDTVYYEVKKFLKLALAGNPSILEVLWAPDITYHHPLAMDLISMRQHFLSKRIANTYGGYAMGQLKKIRADIAADRDINWKNAMHLYRLLMAGIHALKTGEILVHIEHENTRQFLTEVRNGQWPWETFHTMTEGLVETLNSAAEETTLPEQPNHKLINDWLISVRKWQSVYTNDFETESGGGWW
jgi:predicted nucleotidyltransferase